MKTTKVSKKLSINKTTVSNLEMGVVKGGVEHTGCISTCPCYTEPDYTKDDRREQLERFA